MEFNSAKFAGISLCIFPNIAPPAASLCFRTCLHPWHGQQPEELQLSATSWARRGWCFSFLRRAARQPPHGILLLEGDRGGAFLIRSPQSVRTIRKAFDLPLWLVTRISPEIAVGSFRMLPIQSP